MCKGAHKGAGETGRRAARAQNPPPSQQPEYRRLHVQHKLAFSLFFSRPIAPMTFSCSLAVPHRRRHRLPVSNRI